MSESQPKIEIKSPQNRLEEADLMQRVGSDDAEALEEFYDKYFPRLYSYVYYRLNRDHQHAEDVIQDTLFEAIEKADQFDHTRGNIDAWLITMSRNRIRTMNNTLLHANEKERLWQGMAEDMSAVFPDTDTRYQPDIALQRKEEKEQLEKILKLLPEKYRNLLEQKYEFDKSVREIAQEQSKTEKAIESQLTRARTAFRELYERFQNDPVGAEREYAIKFSITDTE